MCVSEGEDLEEKKLFIFLYNLSKSQSKINIIKFLIKGGKEP
jgi:hypothetical protein